MCGGVSRTTSFEPQSSGSKRRSSRISRSRATTVQGRLESWRNSRTCMEVGGYGGGGSWRRRGLRNCGGCLGFRSWRGGVGWVGGEGSVGQRGGAAGDQGLALEVGVTRRRRGWTGLSRLILASFLSFHLTLSRHLINVKNLKMIIFQFLSSFSSMFR